MNRFSLPNQALASLLLSTSLSLLGCGAGTAKRDDGATSSATGNGGTGPVSVGGGATNPVPGNGGTGLATGNGGAMGPVAGNATVGSEEPVAVPGGSRFGQPITGSGTSSSYNEIPITIGGQSYGVKPNPWGGATQTIAAGDGKIFEVISISGAGENPWDVISYPSVYKGGSYGGAATANSGMPVMISNIGAVYTGMKTNASAITYNGNTTYDVYFTDAEDYSAGGPPTVYLMVWFHAHKLNPINGVDDMWNCLADEPTYIEACTTRGTIVVGGKTFVRFVGNNSEAAVISYAPVTRFDEWEFDLKVFIDDAVAQGVLNPSMYLQSVQGGFELAADGAGLKITDFYADVE